MIHLSDDELGLAVRQINDCRSHSNHIETLRYYLELEVSPALASRAGESGFCLVPTDNPASDSSSNALTNIVGLYEELRWLLRECRRK